MEDVLKMDIFFVVATVITVLIGALIIIALVYAVKFLRTINRISEEVAAEAGNIRADLKSVRAKAGALKFAAVGPLLGKAARRFVSRTKRKKED
ncbi:MAG TPA: hypothetical protein VF696_01795 [Candidatus Paceibacterota bacterium]